MNLSDLASTLLEAEPLPVLPGEKRPTRYQLRLCPEAGPSAAITLTRSQARLLAEDLLAFLAAPERVALTPTGFCGNYPSSKKRKATS